MRSLPVLQDRVDVEAQLAELLARVMSTDYRIPWDPRCLFCDRPRSTHRAVDVGGGEVVVPACEQIHGRGFFIEGPPPPPGPRPPDVTRRRALELPPKLAAAIVGGDLGEPSKMPGPSYGLDAFRCGVGGVLAELPGTTCWHCYARKNFYAMPAVRTAHHKREKAIHHPLWEAAMTCLLIEHVAAGGEPVFRWHDSGDLRSVNHLEQIVSVALATQDRPRILHWLPTREYGIVAQYLREGFTWPDNLCVRLSAWMNEGRPIIPPELAHLPTSTVHIEHGQPIMLGRRRDSVECRAYTRGFYCAKCRACWYGDVKNVSYPIH